MLVASAVTIFIVAACGAAHHRTRTRALVTPRPTSSHIYAPFNGGTVAAGVKVAKTARGYCWTSSGADRRPDAWRCFLDNQILDPCFSNEAGTSGFVLCAQDPWSIVTKLGLTKALPRTQANPETADPTARAPWAVQLSDGTRCTALTGATGAIAGLGLDYGCTGGTVLAGVPRRTTSAWKIFYASGFKAKTLSERSISEAWW
jgi:hypothetical protein